MVEVIERLLTIRSRSPLALHTERTAIQFTPTLDYVPGSSLRGAVAAHYLQEAGTATDPQFHDFFLGEQISFPDLWPTRGRGQPTYVTPATARACKRYSPEEQPESVSDSLLRLALADESRDVQPLKDPKWENCPAKVCQGKNRREGRLSEYYVQLVPEYVGVKARQRMLTGTSINRPTKTVQPGMLFAQRVLEEEQFFLGRVQVWGERGRDQLAALEGWLPPGTRLQIGYGRSRGLGSIVVDGWDTPPVEPDLRDRWDTFNRAIRELWQHYDYPAAMKYFSLTTQSHLVLRDACGQPVTALAGRDDVETLLGLPGVELCRHVICPAVVMGWNAAQGRPKTDAPAIGRGSVLLFRVAPEKEGEMLERLIEIEAEGLGERRGEGFGRVRVCDPFHAHFVLKELGQ